MKVVLFSLFLVASLVQNCFSLIGEETDLNSLSSYEAIDEDIWSENDDILQKKIQEICRNNLNVVYVEEEDIYVDCEALNSERAESRIVKREVDEDEGSGGGIIETTEQESEDTTTPEAENQDSDQKSETTTPESESVTTSPAPDEEKSENPVKEEANVPDTTVSQDTENQEHATTPGQEKTEVPDQNTKNQENATTPDQEQPEVPDQDTKNQENVVTPDQEQPEVPDQDTKNQENVTTPDQEKTEVPDQDTKTQEKATTPDVEKSDSDEKNNQDQDQTENIKEAAEPEASDKAQGFSPKKDVEVHPKGLLNAKTNEEIKEPINDESVKSDESTQDTKAASAGSKDTTILIILFAAVVIVGALAFGYNYVKKRKQRAADLERVERGPVKRSLQNLSKAAEEGEVKPLMRDSKEVEMVDMKRAEGSSTVN